MSWSNVGVGERKENWGWGDRPQTGSVGCGSLGQEGGVDGLRRKQGKIDDDKHDRGGLAMKGV